MCPRVVWFPDPPGSSAPDISDILALGDKLIVDSEHPGAPTFADLRVLAGAGYIVADLAWTRLTKIRQLLAQLIDDHGIDQVRNVSIEYSGAEPSPQARYMQAWLRSGMPDAEVNLYRVGQAGCGDIKAIRVDPDINIQLQPNCAEFKTGTLSQRANLPDAEDHDLLREELSLMTRDHVFERALQRMSVWTPRS